MGVLKWSLEWRKLVRFECHGISISCRLGIGTDSVDRMILYGF